MSKSEPPRRFNPVSPAAIFSKRDLAATALPEEWDSRALPAPKKRVAFAAPREEQPKSVDFGRRWKAWAKRLGLVDTSAVTVLADGARWIWEEQMKHLRTRDALVLNTASSFRR